MSRAGLDVADVLDDPDFHTDDIPWIPRDGRADCDGRTRPWPGALTISGVVYPASGDELVQTSDGDHAQSQIVLITRHPISAGDGDRGGDQIVWEGARYTAIAVKPWPYGPGFHEAVFALADLNPSQVPEPRDVGHLRKR